MFTLMCMYPFIVFIYKIINATLTSNYSAMNWVNNNKYSLSISIAIWYWASIVKIDGLGSWWVSETLLSIVIQSACILSINCDHFEPLCAAFVLQEGLLCGAWDVMFTPFTNLLNSIFDKPSLTTKVCWLGCYWCLLEDETRADGKIILVYIYLPSIIFSDPGKK